MAAAAVPLLEAASKALLVTVGVLGGAAAIEQAQKKDETQSDAKATAQPVAPSRTRSACQKCPPDCGTLASRRWSMSEDARAYQARITGFAPYTEWNFSGADFDGFQSGGCLLQETKARYDQFFNAKIGQPKIFFAFTGAKKIENQALRQGAVALAHPPTQLNWYFMQPISYAYFRKALRKVAPNILSLYQP